LLLELLLLLLGFTVVAVAKRVHTIFGIHLFKNRYKHRMIDFL
jgi:hypothetical protein